MTGETIFSIALSHLSEKDKEAMLAYQSKAVEVQHQVPVDATIAIEDVLKAVPGAKRALKHYDKEVGKLMKARA